VSDKQTQRIVWRWREEVPKNGVECRWPGVARRAVAQAAIPLALGIAAVCLGRRAAAAMLLGVAAALTVCGFAFPRAFRNIERFGRTLSGWVAQGLTYGLLVPIFLLVFLPGRLILLALGRDPMRRRWRGRDATYWTPHADAPDTARYRKQY